MTNNAHGRSHSRSHDIRRTQGGWYVIDPRGRTVDLCLYTTQGAARATARALDHTLSERYATIQTVSRTEREGGA